MRHTRGYWTGRPATYFALHQKGFFLPPTSPSARWALTPPFHPYPSDPPYGGANGRYVFCDTVRRRALTRAARACGEACAASCPMVSGLSSPNSKTGAALPAPWDQRTRSDDLAPKLRGSTNRRPACTASPRLACVPRSSRRSTQTGLGYATSTPNIGVLRCPARCISSPTLLPSPASFVFSPV